MKRCSYCGAEYSEDAGMCAIDHEPLQSDAHVLVPAQTQEVSQPSDEIQPESNQEAAKIHMPGYFRCLWGMKMVDADRLLERFAEAGIEFKIEPIVISQQQIEMFMGYPPIPRINVYVPLEDKENAMEIMAGDWKM